MVVVVKSVEGCDVDGQKRRRQKIENKFGKALRIWPIYVNKRFPLSPHVTVFQKRSTMPMKRYITGANERTEETTADSLSHTHTLFRFQSCIGGPRSNEITRAKVNSSKTVMGYEMGMYAKINTKTHNRNKSKTQIKRTKLEDKRIKSLAIIILYIL